jgi:DNA-binding CsgD family transcriptional regulator
MATGCDDVPLGTIPEIWYSAVMASFERALDRLGAAADRGSDLVTLWREVAPVLREAVPHFETPCFFTVDPASLLVTSHFQEGLPEIPAEWLGREYAQEDYNTMGQVLASRAGIGTLHDATSGRPELSRKYHEEMEPFGCDQELVLALRTRDGECWGSVGLYREAGAPLFGDAESAFLRAAAPLLARGARLGLRTGQALEPDLPDAPAVVVLDAGLHIVSATSTAERWLDLLGGTRDRLPESVVTAAGRARRPEDGPATARVLGRDGRWALLHGSALQPGDQVSVLVEAAQPAHLETLLMQAHGLTARERDVTRLVLRGRSTTEVAARLAVTEATVQQHLKSVFEKTGVHSRRELVATVFHSHYEPRVRDNEHRAGSDRPLRDGPMSRRTG